MTAAVVFDSSAALALIQNEPGAEVVAAHVGRAAISAVNLQEVVVHLVRQEIPGEVIGAMVQDLRLEVHAHDAAAAFEAGLLWRETKTYGRGLGDRSCLALARRLGVPALTCDREWRRVKVAGVEIRLAR